MDLSVVICTYDRSHSLSKTIDCLMNQSSTGSLVWELLIVDNNSSDDTKAVVSGHQKKTSNKIKYIFEPKQGKWKVSMYSNHPKANCDEVMQRLDGGGHFGAAGAMLSTDDFCEFLEHIRDPNENKEVRKFGC